MTVRVNICAGGVGGEGSVDVCLSCVSGSNVTLVDDEEHGTSAV